MRALALVLAGLAAAALGCNDGGGGGVCDCRAGQVCIRGRCFDSSPPFDEQVATPASCAAPAQAAGPALPAAPPASCTAPVRASTSPPEWVQALGPRAVGSEVTFTVPAGASSLSIVLQAVSVPVTALKFRTGASTVIDLPNTAVPLVVRAPDGTVWYDDNQPLLADPSGQLVFFASSSPVVGSLTIPNTARALEVTGLGGLPAGTWTFTVSDYAHQCATIPSLAGSCGESANLTPAPDLAAYRAGTYDATVLVRPGARPSPGTLDVAFYLQACPGAGYDASGACLDPRPLTAATAAADPDAQRMLQAFTGLVSGAGVCVGTVTWYDLPAWAQERWKAGLDLDATTCEASLGQLLALSQPGSALNLFLVPDIIPPGGPADGTQVVGIDGTIPGPASFSGTIQSGAAVSAANLRERPDLCTGPLSLSCGADATAYIAAHEAGHFLGLYHTTESGGTSFDQLTDTPRCECSACSSGGTAGQCGTATAEVTGQSCVQATEVCGGGRNLMFWVLSNVSQGKVSPQQSDVIRSSPLVR